MAIMALAEDSGWTLDASGGASRTFVLEYSNEGVSYTIAVTAPPEDESDEPVSVAFYYPAGAP